MPNFIALLRGINVGRANRIAMADLRAVLADRGLDDVRTLLNSGNVVFRADGGTPAAHAADIAAAMASAFALTVPVVVKAAAELEAIMAANPLDTTDLDPSRVVIVFAQERRALAELSAIASLVAAPEEFVLGDDAAYLSCPDGLLASKAARALLGASGQGLTTRNLATVRKLRDLAGADD